MGQNKILPKERLLRVTSINLLPMKLPNKTARALNKFLQLMPSHITQRGLTVYNSGDQICDMLFEAETKTITARVIGTQTYEVTLILTNNEVREVQCTCPYNGHCKHIAGVIYSIVLDVDNTEYQ